MKPPQSHHRTPIAQLLAAESLDPDSITQMRGGPASLVDFEERRARCVRRIADERGFPEGWWHGDDLESALAVMVDRFTDLGLVAPLDRKDLAKAAAEHVSMVEGEDTVRRHVIGHAVREANGFLTGMGRAEHFYAFAPDAPGWDASEPMWLLLTASERELLLRTGVLHPPTDLELSYDPVATPRRTDD